MSQDLFAAFDNRPSSVPPASHIENRIGSTGLSKLDSGPRIDGSENDPFGFQAEDEDDFGDFEDASVAPATMTSSSPAKQVDSMSDLPTYPPPKLRNTAISTFQAPTSKAAPIARSSPPKSQPPSTKKAQPAPSTSTKPTYPPPKSKPQSSPPITKKPEPRPVPTGSHPFAGHMDILFSADDDEYDAGQDELHDLSNNPEAAMAYSKKVIAAQEAEREGGKGDVEGNGKDGGREMPEVAAVSAQGKAQAVDVLFDVDDPVEEEAGEDDFGDFEGEAEQAASSQADVGVQMPVETESMTSAFDLLGLDDAPEIVTTKANAAPSKPTTGKAQTSRTITPKGPSKSEAQQPASLFDDDSWDDFEEFTAPSVNPTTLSIPPERPRSTSTKPTADDTTDKIPPTNVPPPVVLLSVFPHLFTSAQEALLDPLSKLDAKQRQVLAAHPATHQFLRGYIRHATALAHILAGRKLRWKRDQFLAQGMRIGPAAAGGGRGGMKLAGLDKTESVKEDREVLDTLKLWRAQLGKLRSAVAAAAATSTKATPALPGVPELADVMPVKSLKAVEGGFTAPHACALCGLKREERVVKVDVDVEDSFGEWWVQGVDMHLACGDFWEEYRGRLKGR